MTHENTDAAVKLVNTQFACISSKSVQPALDIMVAQTSWKPITLVCNLKCCPHAHSVEDMKLAINSARSTVFGL